MDHFKNTVLWHFYSSFKMGKTTWSLQAVPALGYMTLKTMKTEGKRANPTEQVSRSQVGTNREYAKAQW